MSGKVRCTATAKMFCIYGEYCEDGEEIPEDSGCGKFILEIAMREEVNMDYKELIDRLQTSAMFCPQKEYICLLCSDAATAIETLLAEREADMWINVEDRLPELYKPVLVAHVSGVVEEMYLAGDGKWNFIDGGYRTRVTHWMPLPTPPEQEKEKNNAN